MDWTEIMKTTGPAAVGAFSAILSAVLTNWFGERRHTREMTAKGIELAQRRLESLIPVRLASHQAVFVYLHQVKSTRSVTTESLDALVPHLLWLEPTLSQRVLQTLGGFVSRQTTGNGETLALSVSELQAALREAAGATALDRLFQREATRHTQQ